MNYNVSVTGNNIGVTLEQVDYGVSLSRTGGQGAHGYSAYELAVQDGFVGTLQEWLDSLAFTVDALEAYDQSAAQHETNAALSRDAALASQQAALVSEQNADASEAAALVSRQAALLSEQNADSSEAGAANSASSAAGYSASAQDSAIAAQANEDTTLSYKNLSLQYKDEAVNSANSAANSASTAVASANSALSHSQNSSERAVESANSATSAAASAVTAANNAANSAISANEANDYLQQTLSAKNTAITKATEAATSAANAAASEQSALTSKVSALNSVNSAITQANAAATSASQALNYRNTAGVYSSNATNKANQAATSEANAAASSASAATSAQSALDSSNTAISKASEAAQSAANAASSAAGVNAKYASFSKLYLGELSSDPTVDSLGNPVIVGAIYLNTVQDRLRIYEETGWDSYDSEAQIATSNALVSATQAASSAASANTSASTAITQATIAMDQAELAFDYKEEALASRNSATVSASVASTKANEALSSASSATSSMNSAIASAANSASSAAAAAASDSSALLHATSAAASASSASSNAINADGSADLALISATNASTSASSASISASASATSATASATSANNAAVSASTSESAKLDAMSAKTDAQSYATSASTSATAAANSASSAGDSATSASDTLASIQTIESNVESIETALSAMYTDFDKKYLGAKSTSPTLDNSGNALIEGAIYFNTTDDLPYVYSGTSWMALVLIDALINSNNLSDVSDIATATTNLGLGTNNDVEFNSLLVSQLKLSTTTGLGNLTWNDTSKTLETSMGNNVNLQHGEEVYYPLVKNVTGLTIPDGTPVRAVGTDGTYSYIAPMLADGSINSNAYLGLTTESIAPGALGRVTFFGRINGLDTSLYPAGTTLYVSDTVAGGFITYAPQSPSHIILVGSVTKQGTTDGRIFVRHRVIPEAWEITYDNVDADLLATNVKAALDELSHTKADVSLLNSNITVYATTVAGDFGYNKLVSSVDDPDYNDTATAVSTGVITTDNQLIGALIAKAGLFIGNPGLITIPTIGNIAKVAGNSNAYAAFYFQLYKRTSGGVESLVGVSNTTPSINPGDANYYQFSATALLSNGAWLSTDRLVIKYYADLTGNTGSEYNFQFGGMNPVRTELPVPVSVIPDSVAHDILVETNTFNGKLSGSDSNVQLALETLDNHHHDLEYEAIDTTILRSADIGSTVQGYNVNTVTDATYVHTDNNYTTVEKSKLAGIEPGATGDMTAAEILTAIKTVDGSGSGLDADLLDGYNSSYFATAQSVTDAVSTANAYTNSAVAGLVDSSPATLDTLNELAVALGDDPNFATTITTSIGVKANKTTTISAGTGLTGGGDLSANRTISHEASTVVAGTYGSTTLIPSVTVDSLGHITTITTNTVALPTVGNGSLTVNTGSGLSGGGLLGTANQLGNTSLTVSHADTSTQASITATANTFITGLTFDEFGHVTGATTGTATSYTDADVNANLNTDTATVDQVLTWNGVGYVWVNQSDIVASGGGLHIGETTPVDPAAKPFWWNSANATLYVYYTDVDSSQWVVANPSASSSSGANEAGTILLASTTGSTEVEMFVNGVENSRFAIGLNKTVSYNIELTCRRADSPTDHGYWSLKGVAIDVDGTVSDLGSLYEVIVARTDAALAVDIRADNTAKALGIYVTGANAKSFSWKAILTTVEI